MIDTVELARALSEFVKNFSLHLNRVEADILRGLLEKYPTVFFYANT